MLPHQAELVAREVIVRHVVVTPSATQLAPQPALACVVEAACGSTRKGFEVRDREHDASVAPGDPGHLRQRERGPVEMVDRTLADHRVEALGREGKCVGPASHPHREGPGRLGGEQSGQSGHPRRGLRAHHETPMSGERARVLAEAARNVEDPPPGASPGQAQRALRHAREEKLAVARGSGRNHVPHVSIEVDDAHLGAP